MPGSGRLRGRPTVDCLLGTRGVIASWVLVPGLCHLGVGDTESGDVQYGLGSVERPERVSWLIDLTLSG